MSKELKRYEKYKETNMFWATYLPENWKEIKIKHLFFERSEKGFPNEPLLSATQSKGVIPTALYENRTVVATKGLETLKLVEVGDFVISLRSFQGGIEYAYYRGIISPAYTVMTPKNNIHWGYFKYLAKSNLFIDLLKTCVTGIREGQNINYSLLKKSYIPVPSISEQIQIEHFLDFITFKINKFIKAKKHEIELLKEQKQAEINHAVTKGLNPDVRMKDSNIEWLGKVPEHWVVQRNKDILFEKKEVVGEDSSLFDLLSLTTKGVILRDITSNKGKFPKDFDTYKKVEPNDLIFCFFDVDETPRTVGLSNNSGMITGAYDVFSVHNANTEFIYYYYLSIDNRKALRPLYKGLRKVVPMPSFKSAKIYHPPINEQIEIVQHINKKVSFIEDYILKIEQEISLIQEYKDNLISEVVTGKVDVRDFKVDQIIEMETLDISDVEVESEELAEE